MIDAALPITLALLKLNRATAPVPVKVIWTTAVGAVQGVSEAARGKGADDWVSSRRQAIDHPSRLSAIANRSRRPSGDRRR